MTVEFHERLATGLGLLGIALPPESTDRLARYFSELKKWSRKVNLIAKSASDEQIIENHFLDSLTLLPLLTGPACHLLDIGTGAGFPGLVCKAARPELSLTLVEPRAKRVSFLGHIVRTLGLTGVEVLCCRAEDEELLPADGPFSHITGRAVTEIGPFLQMVERFSPAAPRVILMKGPKWREELTAATAIVDSSPFRLGEVKECELPFSGARRALLLFSQNLPRSLRVQDSFFSTFNSD
jgi:16S rRNA (guanine527-N7)-methyltransferase